MAISNVNTPWSQVANYVEKNSLPGDGVVVYPTYAYISYDFYAITPAIPLQPLRLVTGISSPFNTTMLERLPEQYKRVWYVYNKRSGTEADLVKTEIETLLQNNFVQKEQQNWHELQLILYEKKPL
jgi:uncharacterized protein YqgQ